MPILRYTEPTKNGNDAGYISFLIIFIY